MDWHASHVQVRSFLKATAESKVDVQYLTMAAHNILYCSVNANHHCLPVYPTMKPERKLVGKIESSNVVLYGKSVALSNSSGKGLKKSEYFYIYIYMQICCFCYRKIVFCSNQHHVTDVMSCKEGGHKVFTINSV